MEPTYSRDIYQSPSQSLAIGQYMAKVYMWMSIGILVTALSAVAVISDEQIFYSLIENRWMFYGLMIAEFGLVIWLSAGINKMTGLMATALFLLYCFKRCYSFRHFSHLYPGKHRQRLLHHCRRVRGVECLRIHY
jgi:FtsH-binding integral membrane protein